LSRYFAGTLFFVATALQLANLRLLAK